jgi:putative ABC transport system substrate-binding protein
MRQRDFLGIPGGATADAAGHAVGWRIIMQRRTFMTGLAATACLPRAVLAQTSAIPEIVLFYVGPTASAEARAKLIRDTLSTEGFVEGKSFVLSMSVASDKDQLLELAKGLVRPSVRAILAVGPVALRAARTVTATIPIVALDLETDPVKAGFAESLSHPGGNVTGLFFDFPEYSGKLLGLLQEARPGLSRVAALWDPTSGSVQIEAAVIAATERGLQLQTLKVDDLGKLPDAFAAADAEQAQGLVILSSPLFSAISGIKQVAEQAALHRLPGITLFPEFATSGGLMGYGPSVDDLYSRPATMIAKILRGEKPGDLPLERPSRYRFVVNLKAAKALHMELPPALVARADEVIE